ncbi:MAG: amino acid ABC transporter permease [Pseudomonadota bacterium]
MLDLTFMIDIAPKMARALLVTVAISVIAVAASVVIGALFTGVRMLGARWARWTVIAFVEFTRGVPPLVHIAIIYFLLPEAGLLINEFWTGVVALALIGGGYAVEIFRASIISISAGQTEAARALGLPPKLSFRLVLLPQAIRRSLPPLTNELANIIKASSLLSVISVNELTKVANDLIFVHFVVVEVLIELTLLYLVIVGILMLLSRHLEARFAL